MRRIVVSAVVLLASAQLFAQGSIGGFGMGGGGAGPGGDVMMFRKDQRAAPINPEFPPVSWQTQTMIATAGVGCEWRITAKTGDVLVAEAESEVFDPALRLIDEKGKMLAENDDRKEGVQTPLLVYRFARDQDVKVIVNSFRAAAGGKFNFRHFIFKSTTARLGTTELETPLNAVAEKLGLVGTLVHFKAEKGKTYSISNLQSSNEGDWYDSSVSGAIFGPSGVKSADFIELKNGTERIDPSNPKTIRALKDGDFFVIMPQFVGGQKFRISVNALPVIQGRKDASLNLTIPPRSGVLVSFPVVADDLVETTIKSGKELINFLEGPEPPEDFAGLQTGVRGEGYWGVEDRFTWFQRRHDSDSVTRAFYGTGEATIIISNRSYKSTEVSVQNSLDLPKFADAQPVDANLPIAESAYYAFESNQNDMMRLRAVATAFRLKLEIIDYKGVVRNSFLDEANNRPGDDLFFPNKEKFILRVSCLGNGGSGNYTLKRDAIPTIPLTVGPKSALQLDGKNFGIYQVELPAKRMAVQVAYRGQLPNVMLLSESGQFMNRRFYQYDDYTLSVFAIDKPGKYRLWIRGGASEVQFKVSEFKPPTIDD
jgi:hypothetical protein